MSEEKLYAVKNDEGKYWNFEDQDGFWKLSTVLLAAFTDEESAKSLAHEHGGHVVTLIEEPEKVVLTKEQAEIVEDAHESTWPAYYITQHTFSSDDEILLMNAYVNGYTATNEKKYNVKVPHAVDSYFKKIDANHCIAVNKFYVDIDEDLDQFTETEIEHYGLQDCEKKEVTDDEQ